MSSGFSGALVYVILWFLVLYLVLPFGVRTPEEAGIALEPGQASSAPVRPRLGVKFLVTTVIATALWGIYYWVAASGLISFRDPGN